MKQEFIAMLGPLLSWMQGSRIASTIADSTLLGGLLSAIHLLGMTLLVGGALVSTLKLLGVIFPEQPVSDVTTATDRGMILGLTISVGTGLLLFAPRASEIVQNSFFQTKMLLLLTAGLFHFAVRRRVTGERHSAPGLRRFAGACGFALWFGVALAGCAFILLE